MSVDRKLCTINKNYNTRMNHNEDAQGTKYKKHVLFIQNVDFI